MPSSPSIRSPPLSTGSGISTGSADSSFSTGRKPQRRRKRGNGRSKEDRSGGGAGSVLWTILIIGLTFCLIDVLYIVGFVDRQHIFLEEEAMGSRSENDSNTPIHVVHRESPRLNPVVTVKSGSNEKLDQSEIDSRQEILNLISEAGVHIDFEKDADLIRDLPTWEEVTNLFGKEPVIYGLDQCEVFQKSSDPADHFVSTAGTFNTGTNLMAELLIANCHMQARMDKYGSINRGVRWQVPWGKHTPPGDEEFRQSHKTLKDANIDANNIFPAVTIRDPLNWLASMCKHPYAAHWEHEDGNCPDFGSDSIGAFVKYAEFTREHESILHLWNDYYKEYLDVSFPRLIVRFEDLVFHPKEVTKTVCECAGGTMRPDNRFKYIVDSAKKGKGAHGSQRTGYIDALVKYGSEKRRYASYSRASDLEYVRDHIDSRVMEAMKYPSIDPTKVNSP